MIFQNIIGNNSAKNLLRNTLSSGHIGHAYIFDGMRGTGRMTMAKEFAGVLLDTNNPESHPDFVVVTNQLYDTSKKQVNVLVDTIRNMKKDIYIKPYKGKKKIYVIPHADTMQVPAQNSILKVFEEPPEYCIIILLAENTNAFLPTIVSRATLVRFVPVKIGQAAEYLEKEKGIGSDTAKALAAMSGGAIGRAIELADNDNALKLRNGVIDALVSLSLGTSRNMYDFVRFMKQNRADIRFVFEILNSCGDDLLHIKFGGSGCEIKNYDRKEDLTRIGERLTKKAVVELNETTIKYHSMIAQNVNYSAAVLCMALEYREVIHDRDSRR